MILFTPLTPCSLKESLSISDAGGCRRKLKLVQKGIVWEVGEAGKVKLSIHQSFSWAAQFEVINIVRSV